MHDDNPNTGPGAENPLPQMLYRGLYGRIAKKLGLDASYVSRVARGERYSKEVETALREEIDAISNNLRSARMAVRDGNAARSKGKRLKNFINKNVNSIRLDFLAHSQSDPGLRNLLIPPRKRGAPISALLGECTKLMVFTPKQMRTTPFKAAAEHGRMRRDSGFGAIDLVEEYNLIRRCIFSLAEKHFSEMDTRMLLHDIAQMDEVLDLQLQNALKVFLSKADKN